MHLLHMTQVISCVRRAGVWVVALVGTGLAVLLPTTGSGADKPDTEKRPALKPLGDPVRGTADPVPPRVAPAPVRVFVSPDAKMVCVKSKDGKTFVWDIAKQVKALELDGAAVPLDFCVGDKWLLVNLSGMPQLWDTATGKAASGPLPRTASVGPRALSADGTTFAQYDRDKKVIQVWETLTAKPLCEPIKPATVLAGHAGMAAPTSYFMLDVRPLTQSVTMRGHEGDALMLSPDGKVLLTQNEVKESAFEVDIFLWDVATGKQIAQLDVPKNKGHAHHGYACCFSPDGKTLAALGGCAQTTKVSFAPSEVRFFDAATGKATGKPIKVEDNTQSAIFLYTPDGKSVLTQRVPEEGGTELVLYDRESGKATRRFALSAEAVGVAKSHSPYGTNVVAFAPDGKTLLTAADYIPERGPVNKLPAPLPGQAKDGYTHCVLAWDVETGKPLAAPEYFKTKVVQLVPAPDGKSFWTATGVEWDIAGVELHSSVYENRFLSEAQQWQSPERPKSPGESEKDKAK